MWKRKQTLLLFIGFARDLVLTFFLQFIFQVGTAFDLTKIIRAHNQWNEASVYRRVKCLNVSIKSHMFVTK